MVADTSSAPAASTVEVGPSAVELAELIVEPIFERSVAAAATYSGAATMYDTRGYPQKLVRPPLATQDELCPSR